MQFNTYAPYRNNAPKPSPKASQVIEKQPQEISEDPVDIFVDFKRLISGSPQISRLQKLKNELAEAIKTTNKIARKRNGKKLPRLITPQHKLLRTKDKTEPKIMFVKSSTKNKWSKKKQASKAQKKPIDLGKGNKHDSQSLSTNNTTPNNDIVNQSNDNIKPENDSASVYTNTEKNEFFCTPEEQPFISSLESAPLTLISSSADENGSFDEKSKQIELLDSFECSFNDSSTYIDSSDVSSGCYDFSTDTILDTEPPTPVKAARNAHEVLEDPIDIFVDFQKLLPESPKTSRSQKTKNDLSNVHPSRQKNIKVKSKKLPKLITPQHKLMRVKNRPEPKMKSLKEFIKNRCLNKKSACTVQESTVELGNAANTSDTDPDNSLSSYNVPSKETLDQLTKIAVLEKEFSVANCTESEPSSLDSKSELTDFRSKPVLEEAENSATCDSFHDGEKSTNYLESTSIDSTNESFNHSDDPERDTTTAGIWCSLFDLPHVADDPPDSAADLDFEQEEFWEEDEYEVYEEEYDFLYAYKRKHH